MSLTSSNPSSDPPLQAWWLSSSYTLKYTVAALVTGAAIVALTNNTALFTPQDLSALYQIPMPSSAIIPLDTEALSLHTHNLTASLLSACQVGVIASIVSKIFPWIPFISSCAATSSNHPLYLAIDTVLQTTKPFVFQETQERTILQETHLHPYGRSVVKGQNIQLYRYQNTIALEFKLTRYYHALLFEQLRRSKENEKLTMDNPSNCHVYSISNIGYLHFNRPSPGYITAIPSTPSVENLAQLLARWGLQSVLEPSSTEELTRLKLGHLYHHICPREAIFFERPTYDKIKSRLFYTLSIDELKERFVQDCPLFAPWTSRLSEMQPHAIMAGRIRYTIPYTNLPFDALLVAHGTTMQHLEAILSLGILSHSLAHPPRPGQIHEWVYYSCESADGVFGMIRNKEGFPKPLSEYDTDVVLAIQSDILRTGCYQFANWEYGVRADVDVQQALSCNSDGRLYKNRLSLQEFLPRLLPTKNSSTLPVIKHNAHEIIFKERIAPEFVTGVYIHCHKPRVGPLYRQFLANSPLIQTDEQGNRWFRQKPVDEFFHCIET